MPRIPNSLETPILNPKPIGWPLMMSAAIGTLAFVAKRPAKPLELSVPVGDTSTVDTLYIRIRADIDVSGTVPTGPVTAGIAGLLERVRIEVNNRDELIDLTAFAMTTLARDDYRKKLEGDDVLSLASKSYDLIIPIDMRMLNSVFLAQTALDMRLARRVNLRVDFGDINSLYGTPESATIVDGSVQIDISYGGTLNNTFARGMHWRSLMEERVQVTSDNGSFEILREENRAASEPLLRTFLRSIRLQGVAGEISTQVFDESRKLVVKIGTQTIVDEYLSVIRAQQKNITNFSPAGADYVNIPFFKNGNTYECPPMDTLTGGLTITGGVISSAGSELSILTETVRRPILL